MGLLLPIDIVEGSRPLRLTLTGDAFSVIQEIFFQAEEFLFSETFKAQTGHSFDDIDAFRSLHLLEKIETLSLTTKEYDLLLVIMGAEAGGLVDTKPMAGHQYLSASDFVSESLIGENKELSRHFAELSKFIRPKIT